MPTGGGVHLRFGGPDSGQRAKIIVSADVRPLRTPASVAVVMIYLLLIVGLNIEIRPGAHGKFRARQKHGGLAIDTHEQKASIWPDNGRFR